MGHSYTKQSRETILAMSIGPGMMVYFMYGVLNKCMDLIYLIWMIIVGTVAVVDLQVEKLFKVCCSLKLIILKISDEIGNYL